MRLIDADALKKEIFEHCRSEKECLNHFWFDENLISLVDNAPTVKDRSFEIAQKSIELGRKVGQLEGKLERPQGDLISRSELKKCAIPCQIHNGALTDLYVPLYQIDNAPTVELTEEYDLPNTHIDVYSYRCGWNEALNRAGIALKSGIRPIRRQKNDK